MSVRFRPSAPQPRVRAVVVQLAEHLLAMQKVMGSNPIHRSKPVVFSTICDETPTLAAGVAEHYSTDELREVKGIKRKRGKRQILSFLQFYTVKIILPPGPKFDRERHRHQISLSGARKLKTCARQSGKSTRKLKTYTVTLPLVEVDTVTVPLETGSAPNPKAGKTTGVPSP